MSRKEDWEIFIDKLREQEAMAVELEAAKTLMQKELLDRYENAAESLWSAAKTFCDKALQEMAEAGMVECPQEFTELTQAVQTYHAVSRRYYGLSDNDD